MAAEKRAAIWALVNSDETRGGVAPPAPIRTPIRCGPSALRAASTAARSSPAVRHRWAWRYPTERASASQATGVRRVGWPPVDS